MKKNAKKWIAFTLRWGVAVVGITWILLNTPFRDQIMLVDGKGTIQRMHVLGEPAEAAGEFQYIDPATGRTQTVSRSDVWTRPDNRSVKIKLDGKVTKAKLLAIRPGAHHTINEAPAELLVLNRATHKPLRVKPQDVPKGYHVRLPYPLVDIGIFRLVRHAQLGYLLAALMVLPLSYLITSRRWHLLLDALDIHLSQASTFVLNMVGSFYNSFMPGSTGGDLVKAYYAAKHTTHKVRAVLSVIVDRLIGVIALIILGGIMCATQWRVPECQQVGLISAGILLATAAGLIVFYHPRWREKSGLNWLLARMPMQRHVHHAVEAMELYGRRPRAAVAALLMTFPVHITTIISGTLAGLAFGIHLHDMPAIYYWTVVPVITLVAAIPISPQGAGVMEAFAIILTKNHGVTISQAIALAMALRFGQMFWNLVAGLFVLRGGYHAPTEAEQDDLETDSDGPPGGDRNSPLAPAAKSEPPPSGPAPAIRKNVQPA